MMHLGDELCLSPCELVCTVPVPKGLAGSELQDWEG